MPEKSHDTLFVGLKDPTELRKNTLESSKSIIECLQRFEKLRFIREEKRRETARFKAAISEIEASMTKLKAILPKPGLPPLSESKEKEEEQKEIEVTEKMEEVVQKTIRKEKDREDDFIDAEIEAIRKKVRSSKPIVPRIAPKPKPLPKKIAKPKATQKLTPTKPIKEEDDLAKLENELKAIEEKLGQL